MNVPLSDTYNFNAALNLHVYHICLLLHKEEVNHSFTSSEGIQLTIIACL